MSWTHFLQWRLDLDNINVYYNEKMTGLDHYPILSNYKTIRYTLVSHSSMSSNSILDIYAVHSIDSKLFENFHFRVQYNKWREMYISLHQEWITK